ncbi:MAG TPA: hypothetical protein DD641_06890 [Deltaproteobacteria bacterium]|nr:hypothetical protein [Deltaproteobacteria bacterium]
MKIRNTSLARYTMLLLGAVFFIGGCATTGLDRAEKTSNSIRDVDSEIRKMIVEIDATTASLEALIVPGKTDLKEPFDSYSKNLKNLDKEGTKVLKRMDEMKASSTAYFSEWEKQGDVFTNAEIRELSEQRRSKLAETYARVPAAGAGIRGSYNAYITDLKEIQKYLSNDLTPKGIEGITPVAQKSVQEAEALKSSLGPVITALDEIKAELYSGKK